MWFRGLTKLSVDAKGRVAMPKAHRDVLDESGVVELVVTASPARCLNVYAKDAWIELEKKLMAAPNIKSKAVQKLQRLYVGYATPVELDGSGRMLLTSELRSFAGIDRKAMLVGQGEKFELWDESRWEREFGLCDDDDIDMSDVPEELSNLSL
ncbi:MAG: division/cell wall cluster transcriptional repressor MraZ [Granulosicoccus sp.]